MAKIFDSHYFEGVKYVGVKILYDHFYAVESVADLLTTLKSRRTLVLHVQRRNYLAQYYSLKMAERTGVWLVNSETPYAPSHDQRRLTIYIPDLLLYFGMLFERERMAKKLLQGQQVMDVWYEDFVADPAAGAAEMCRFLGRKPIDLPSITYRQNTFGLADVIENYDEVVATLSATMFCERFAQLGVGA